jgi:hypothetical protein
VNCRVGWSQLGSNHKVKWWQSKLERHKYEEEVDKQPLRSDAKNTSASLTQQPPIWASAARGWGHHSYKGHIAAEWWHSSQLMTTLARKPRTCYVLRIKRTSCGCRDGYRHEVVTWR